MVTIKAPEQILLAQPKELPLADLGVQGAIDAANARHAQAKGVRPKDELLK